ncbi:MAG: PadR family transcriptional regulator [Chloroflexota bacterium]
MSLKYAILGFLTLEPMSGYRLKKEFFDKSVRNFWPADQAQIYRTLYKLEQEKWISSALIPQANKPDQKRYSISELGQTELRSWLVKPIGHTTERNPFLLQLYFARHLSQAELLSLLQERLKNHRARLEIFEMVDLQPLAVNEVMKEQIRFGGYTLDFGLRYERMQIEWLEDVIEDIK